MSKPDYSEYINSEAWRDRRWKKIRDDGSVLIRCEKCLGFFASPQIHVHHLTYERLGDEANSDLEILCKFCHENTHGRQFSNVPLLRPSTDAKPACETIRLGLPSIDSVINGVAGGAVTVLAASPGVGTTAFAIQLACNAALVDKTPTVFIDLSSSREACCERMMLHHTRIPRRSDYSDEEKEAFRSFAHLIRGSSLYIDSKVDMSCDELCEVIERCTGKYSCKLVIVDGLQDLASRREANSKSDFDSMVVKSMKALARRTGAAIFCCSTLKRIDSNRPSLRPRFRDMHGSGSVEHDADQIWFLYREGYYRTDVDHSAAEFLVGKNVNGFTGGIRMVWNDEIQRFSDVDGAADAVFGT